MKVAITGHRAEEFKDGQGDRTNEWLTSMGEWMKERGMTELISGMATGADLWWAEKHKALEVPLHAYVPFWKQAAKWDVEWVMFWDEMILNATDVTVIGKSEPYDKNLFLRRNDAMVDDADEMLVVLKASKNSGGTLYTFKAWQDTQRPWHWYDPETNIVKHGTGAPE